MNNNASCSICLEPLKNKKQTIHTTPCNHSFHTPCINKWIKSKIIKVNSHSGWGLYLTGTSNNSIEDSSKVCVSMYDSGEFDCPVCKSNYMFIHPSDLQTNMSDKQEEGDEKMMKYRKFKIKVKYASDGTNLHDFWFSQYFETFEDFFHEFFTPNPECLRKKLGLLSKSLSQISHLLDEKEENNTITVHALICHCNKSTCDGFWFVPEEYCPLCVNPLHTIIMPDHIDHASSYQIQCHMINREVYLLKNYDMKRSATCKHCCDHEDHNHSDDSNNSDSDADTDIDNTNNNNDTDTSNNNDNETDVDDDKKVKEHKKSVSVSNVKKPEHANTVQNKKSTRGRGGNFQARGRGRGRGRGNVKINNSTKIQTAKK
jgi:hypothetical protein